VVLDLDGQKNNNKNLGRSPSVMMEEDFEKEVKRIKEEIFKKR
jgi:hypothetical protein